MTDAPDPAAPLLPVRMDDGLLLCPHCGSMDLMPESPEVLSCDDCHGRCSRFDDQCPKCGERGVTQVELVGFSAPGQAPSQAPRRIVKRCDECGWTNE